MKVSTSADFHLGRMTVSWGRDRLDVFVRGAGNNVFHKAWDGTSWLPGGFDWDNLGGVSTHDSEPALVSWGRDRLDVFVRGVGDRLFHKAWDGIGWLPGGFDWEDLGGVVAPPSQTEGGVTEPVIPDAIDLSTLPQRLQFRLRNFIEEEGTMRSELMRRSSVGSGRIPGPSSWDRTASSSPR
jgi:hypothetical protein